jgi:DNA-directed RNA polymerase specialized sigma subunit
MPNPPKLEGPFSGQGLTSKLEQEYDEPYNQWKSEPNKRTSGALLKAINPVIDQATYSAAGNQASPTLRSRARQEALKAMDSYDPQKGRLKTHLLSRLRRLHRIHQEQSQIIPIPEQVLYDRQNLIDIEKDLTDELGRDPSDQEIADRSGLSLKRLAHIRKAHVPVAEGAAMNRPGRSDEEQFLPGSEIPGHDPGGEAWTEYVYADLGVKDKAIMDYMMGLHGTPKLPPNEVGKRLGLSPGAISQRAAKIQALLDERENTGLF